MDNNGKPKVIYVRVSDQDYDDISADARERGLWRSTFMRFVYREWKKLTAVGDAKPVRKE